MDFNHIAFIISVIAAPFVLTAAYAGLLAAPWVPTRKKDVEKLLEMVALKPGQKFYDLGCGDGRLIIAAAELGADAVGFELSLFSYLRTKLKIFTSGSRASVKFRDFWNVDLAKADVVYFFLVPRIYPKMKLKLEKELKKGARVAAYMWPIKGWKPVAIESQKGAYNLYLYQI